MYRGHPTYSEEILEKIVEMFSDGSSITKVCAQKLGIHRDTYYDWQKKYPEFRRLSKLGEMLAESVNEDILDAGTQGKIKGFQVAGQTFKMSRQYRKTYGDASQESIDDNTKALKEIKAELEALKKHEREY